jgi:hypothetical protein
MLTSIQLITIMLQDRVDTLHYTQGYSRVSYALYNACSTAVSGIALYPEDEEGARYADEATSILEL